MPLPSLIAGSPEEVGVDSHLLDRVFQRARQVRTAGAEVPLMGDGHIRAPSDRGLSTHRTDRHRCLRTMLFTSTLA